jgi:hypothetical protein
MNGKYSAANGQAVAGAGDRQQHPGLHPLVGHVLARLAVRVQDAGTQQGAGGLRAPGMACGGDLPAVDAAPQAGDRRLDVPEAVQDAGQVGHADAPDVRGARVAGREAEAAGVEMGGLDDHEAVSGPVVGQRRVGVHRPAETVREHDDRQAVTGHRRGHTDLQVIAAARGGDDDRLD